MMNDPTIGIDNRLFPGQLPFSAFLLKSARGQGGGTARTASGRLVKSLLA